MLKPYDVLTVIVIYCSKKKTDMEFTILLNYNFEGSCKG